MKTRQAFTVLEILVVIGVVGLLVVIALPNYQRAQLRSKVSQARGDLRTVAVALEAYTTDYEVFPGDGSQYCWGYPVYPYDRYWHLPDTLSTPVAYLATSRQYDPFMEHRTDLPLSFRRYRYRYIDMTWGTVGTRSSASVYYPFLKEWYGSWALTSVGPDGTFGPYYSTGSYPGNAYPMLPLHYDPTNGVTSDGDLMRSQRAAESL